VRFDLTKPCSECPFRYDINGYLTEERAEEIVEALLRGATFSCHKTNDYGDEGEPIETGDSQHCAGAMILLEHQEQPNQMMRISERIGFYDPAKLDMTAPVFDEPETFIDHHAGRL
jgi:hypothetical protein